MADAEEHFSKLLLDALIKHTRRKDVVRRVSWTLRIGTMFLGMVATIILGLTFEQDSVYLVYSRNGALICSALSTFLAGLASLWNIDHYWIQRKVIVRELESLRDEFQFKRAVSPPLSESQIKLFFKRYRQIIEQQTDYWEVMLARTSPSVEQARGGLDEHST